MKRWYSQKHAAQLTDPMDIDQVLGFLHNTPSTMVYRTHSVALNHFSPYLKAITVERAIKRGHVDMELWVWVNPLHPVVDFSGNRPMTTHEYSGTTQSWVLDLDELEDVWSIKDLRVTMRARNMPLPYYISQTGPNCFHCLYFGHYGDWPERKRLWVMEKWAGIKEKMSKDQWCELVKKSGIDIQYSISQHYGKHAFRVPGTINKNHPMQNGFWRCLGWRNSQYDVAHDLYVIENGQFHPACVPEPNVEVLVTPTYVPDFTVYIEPVEELLSEVFPDGFMVIKTSDVAKMIANNAFRLIHGDCRIHQQTWATALYCMQFDVSRLIKKMVEVGILEKINDSYCKGYYSKTYGAGPLLKPALGWSGMPMKLPAWVRWDDGTSNKRMLYDVRYFYSLGLPDNKIMELLQLRQAHRPKRKQRSPKELASCLRRYKFFLQKHKVSRSVPKIYALDVVI